MSAPHCRRCGGTVTVRHGRPFCASCGYLAEMPKATLAPRTYAQRIRALADLADEMLAGDDKHHWDESNGDGKPGDMRRTCGDCRTIDLAREVADQLDPKGANKPVTRPPTGRAV